MPTGRLGQRQVDPAHLGPVVWTAETHEQIQGNVHLTKELSGNPGGGVSKSHPRCELENHYRTYGPIRYTNPLAK